nr:hypothetical protein [Tanacetum cinerariifolium]
MYNYGLGRIALDGDDDVLDVLSFKAKVLLKKIKQLVKGYDWKQGLGSGSVGSIRRIQGMIALDGDDDLLDVLSFRAKVLSKKIKQLVNGYDWKQGLEFDPSEDPSSYHIPQLPAMSLFLSLTDDSLDSDIPDTPPSPTHGTPFTETTLSTKRSPTASCALRHRVMILTPGQPIPHGRP